MNKAKFEEYKKHCSRDGAWLSPGAFAMTWQNAKKSTPVPIDWDKDRRGTPEARMKLDGFDVVVRLESDDIETSDYLGTFTDKWELGAIARKNPGRNEYKYFVPGISHEDHRKSLSMMGYSKGEANRLASKYVRESMARAERFASGDIGHWCLLVYVYKESIELASQSLGGIEHDSDQEYIDYETWNLVQEALPEAQKTIEKLCACEPKN